MRPRRNRERSSIVASIHPSFAAVAAAGVVDLLLELAADGRTVVMVTHDPAIANLADRIVELREGRVAEVREPRRTRAAS